MGWTVKGSVIEPLWGRTHLLLDIVHTGSGSHARSHAIDPGGCFRKAKPHWPEFDH
jgi:hypothetical protein